MAGSAGARAAALTTGDVLQFAAGNIGVFTTPAAAGASYFSLQTSSISSFYVGLQPGTDGGIVIGKAQAPGASHFGFVAPGDAAAGIDQPWSFLGNTGTHFTITGPSAVSGTTISGVAPINATTLDMSNCRFTWNGVPSVDVGGCSGSCCPSGVTDSHTATFSWDGVFGDAFTLDYSAHVPVGDPSSFGGVPYALHLTGVVQAAAPVPLPAAAWLFGSGLLGLMGAARRKKAG